MNTDTKRHIDSARQVLVGVVPNPSSQIDQITNALIYKFMDDMDQSAIKIGGRPTFFTGDLEKYAWVRIMDSRIGSQERMNLYSEALLKFSQAKQLPPLFRDIFKQAMLPYRSPEVLDMFLKEINYFSYSHSEDLGDAFEYLLSVMSSQGDAGMFRTPRHIIEFIVDVVNPSKDDKILDPACGTAGFLISAYKHILRQHDGLDDPKKIEKPLTPEQKKKLTDNFIGYDISPEMVRLSRVNMYLHNFKDPQIIAYNTLADEERWNDKFDVILANPPFMSPKGVGKPHSKFTIQASKSEVLFVDYIMNHLRPKGRAGIIVPDGIIFSSGKSHKELRKNLVNDGLYAVVSLPSGVFNPYAGVKTSILLFDNEIAKQKTEMLFVKVENDGFDLGATKRPISKNDLPTALDILNKWKTSSVIPADAGIQCVAVEKYKIAESGDYNLSGDRYRIATDYSNAKWSMVTLGEIAEFADDGDWIESKDQADSGIRLVQTGNVGIGEYIDKAGKERYISSETFSRLKCTEIFSGDVLLSRLPDPVGRTCVLPKLGQRAITAVDCTIFRFSNLITAKYFVFLTLSKEYQDRVDSKLSGATRQRISKGNLLEIKIPLPPLEIQEQVVAELDSYASIIAGAKQVAKSWKPRIDIDPEWKKVKLGEIAEYFIGLTYSPEDVSDKGTIVLRSSNIQDGVLDFSNIVRVSKKIKENLIVKDGDILMCSRNGSKRLVGKIAVIKNLTEEMTFGTFMTIVRSEYSQFLSYFFVSDLFRDQIDGSETSSINQITKYMLDAIVVPFPPLAIQKQIVEKIEAERALVESAKKLITIYDQKTKEVVAKLWE